MSLIPAQIARHRASINPLRSLTIARVVSLQEQGEQGIYADLQWLYRHLEAHYPTLRAAKRLRRAALRKLSWTIKISDRARTPEQEAIATAQKATLTAAYEQIGNLSEAISHLATAEFRGYAHLEKIYQDEDANRPILELRPIEQWFWAKSLATGEWLYNPAATASNTGHPVPPARLITREVEDPVDAIAAKCMVRANLSEVDWDGFLEIYGIPPIFVETPANTPPDKVDEYQAMADAVIGDMRGTIPAGTKIQSVTSSTSGEVPFKARIEHLDSQVVLAATSGRLTMLTSSTGMNSGQADAHGDTFDAIALDEAGEITEIFQRQLDAEILAKHHPGQPALAYFEIAAQTTEDLDAYADRLGKLHTAGFTADPAEVSERFGQTLTLTPAPAAFPAPGLPLNNRAPSKGRDQPGPAASPTSSAKLRALMEARAADLAPALKALEPILARLERGDTVHPSDLPDLSQYLTYDATAALLEQDLAEAITQATLMPTKP